MVEARGEARVAFQLGVVGEPQPLAGHAGPQRGVGAEGEDLAAAGGKLADHRGGRVGAEQGRGARGSPASDGLVAGGHSAGSSASSASKRRHHSAASTELLGGIAGIDLAQHHLRLDRPVPAD